MIELAISVFTDIDMRHNRIRNCPDAFETVECTKEQFELWKANGELDENKFYITTDDVAGAPIIVRLSKAQYEALRGAGQLDENTLYFIYDDVMVGPGSEGAIDDEHVTAQTTYSSRKIEDRLNGLLSVGSF